MNAKQRRSHRRLVIGLLRKDTKGWADQDLARSVITEAKERIQKRDLPSFTEPEIDEFSKRGVGGVSRGETCTSLRLTHFVFRPVLFFQPEDGCGTVIEDFNPAVALPHPLAHCLLRNGSSHDGWTWEDDGVFTAVYSVKYRHAEVGGFH